MATVRPPGIAVRLARGWRLLVRAKASPELVAEFIRPAVRAVPRGITARLGPCRIILTPRLEGAAGGALRSRWSESASILEIAVATERVSHHDVAMELLLCLGQALWERVTAGEREAYWILLGSEIEAGVGGEIDEEALAHKQALLASRASARSLRRFQRYARASFAATAGEYIHCLWHEVHLRQGPEHLPAPWLRRRLETFARWFPPNRGYRLFAL